jgi:hypothetical protein
MVTARHRRLAILGMCIALSACEATASPIAPSGPAPSGTPVPTSTVQSSPTAAAATPILTPGAPPSDPTFSIEILRVPRGASEPALAISEEGTALIMAGTWKRAAVADWSTRLWRASAGGTAMEVGSIGRLAVGSRVARPSRDVDLVIDPAGVVHATITMRFFDNPAHPDFLHSERLTTALRCPGVDDEAFTTDRCAGQVVRRSDADRPWIASGEASLWILDQNPDSTRYVSRSLDAGRTWDVVGKFVPGGAAGPLDGYHGPLVADPATGRLAFALTTDLSGHGGENDLLVARSDDAGRTWQTTAVSHGASKTSYGAIFSTIAPDRAAGALYLVWSDEHHVFCSKSLDGAETWSTPQVISARPVATAIQPTVVASADRVDIAYLGTAGTTPGAATNDWNLYLSRSLDGGRTFRQSIVREHVHVGPICWPEDCKLSARTMLDDFEIADDPRTGRLQIAFVTDTLDRDNAGLPLPQIGYAVEEP